MTAQSTVRNAPFSVHARGVPLFQKGTFNDVSDQASRALLDLRDIGSSGFWLFSTLSWFTLFSVLINIVSVSFFSFYGKVSFALPLDWTLVGNIILIPMAGFIWLAYLRRNTCLDLLSEFRTTALFLLYAFRNWIPQESFDQETDQRKTYESVQGVLQEVHAGLADICLSMHEYFLPMRFYSKRFPYFGYKSVMVQIAIDKANHQNRVQAGILTLSHAASSLGFLGVSHQHQLFLEEKIQKMHVVLDKMSNVKEYGSPQGIRSLVYYFINILVPLFFGPYWAFVSQGTDFAFAFFISCVIQIALSGLLNVYLTLEDPWDNTGLSGIFIDEHLHIIEVALEEYSVDVLDSTEIETNGEPADQTPGARFMTQDQGYLPDEAEIEENEEGSYRRANRRSYRTDDPSLQYQHHHDAQMV